MEGKEEQGNRQSTEHKTTMESLGFLFLLRRGISQPDHSHGNVVVRVSGFGIFDELFHRLFRTLDVSNVIDGLLVFRDIPQLRQKGSTH